MVYFISDGQGHVKIGYARDTEARLRALQTASATPLELLAEIDGGLDEEARQHRQFKHLHLRGEWFETGPDLLEHIAWINGGCRREPTEEERRQAAQFERCLQAMRR